MLRPRQRLEVDGGIDVHTAGLCSAAGADVFVAGTNIFRSGDVPGAIAGLRQAAADARKEQRQ
jgi:ribulose-phosphate 3-epimerase